jgi:hypothetical protein
MSSWQASLMSIRWDKKKSFLSPVPNDKRKKNGYNGVCLSSKKKCLIIVTISSLSLSLSPLERRIERMIILTHKPLSLELSMNLFFYIISHMLHFLEFIFISNTYIFFISYSLYLLCSKRGDIIQRHRNVVNSNATLFIFFLFILSSAGGALVLEDARASWQKVRWSYISLKMMTLVSSLSNYTMYYSVCVCIYSNSI